MPEISRRRVLLGSCVLPAIAMTGCDKTPLSGPVASSEPGDGRQSQGLGIGPTQRIRGVNIAPGPDDWSGNSSWAELWKNWNWDGRIKNEIDDALAVGANCVRLMGNTHVLTSSAITKDEYLGRWSQFLHYAQSRGLWVYPCGGDLRHWGNTSIDDARDIYGSWASVLTDYDNVVGVDITNEAYAASRSEAGPTDFREPESWLYTVSQLGELVKDVTGKPITHSRGLTALGDENWEFGCPETDALSDFLDVHVYRTVSVGGTNGLFASDWGIGKQLLIGEFGVPMTADTSARSAFYEDVGAFISSTPNCVGGVAWSIYDAGAAPESQYGLIDGDRQPRLDVTTEFGSFPTTRQ